MNGYKTGTGYFFSKKKCCLYLLFPQSAAKIISSYDSSNSFNTLLNGGPLNFPLILFRLKSPKIPGNRNFQYPLDSACHLTAPCAIKNLRTSGLAAMDSGVTPALFLVFTFAPCVIIYLMASISQYCAA